MTTKIYFSKGFRAICSNSKYYSNQGSDNDESPKKRCSAVISLRPNPDKIKIIEDGMTKRGKTKYIIDPNTSEENLCDPTNYSLYHKHKGMSKLCLISMSSLVFHLRLF